MFLPLAPILIAGSALAADPTTPVADDAGAFKLSLNLEAWFPRLEGNFTDGPADIDVSATDLDDSEPSFAGELGLTRDRLSIALRGFTTATEGRGPAESAFTLGGLSVNAGDALDNSFSWWSAGAVVAYDFYRPLAEQPTRWSDPRAGWTAPANNTDLSVFALVSADVQSMQRELANLASGLSTDANETFAVVNAGLGFRLAFDTKEWFPVVRRVDLGASVAGGAIMPMGGGDFGVGARIEADITFWFCKEGAAYFGYRYIGGSYEGEDLALDGSLQGIRGGIRFEF
ncbi:MAG: hypothetical protein ACK5WD_06205 [bacterium]|jgi:hypothetical protein